MALRRITLDQLYRLARKDRAFFKALLKNPRKAVQKKGRYMTPGDVQRLEKSLKKVYTVSGKNLAEMMMAGRAGIRPWPALKQWPMSSIRPWP